MAEVKLLFMDGDGFHCEVDPAVDTTTFAGMTLNGGLDMTGNTISNVADGVAPGDAINLGQLTAAIEGMDYKESVRLKTIADLGGTFNPTGGTSGTGEFTGAPTAVDGVTIVPGDRILVANQTLPEENGIYVVTAAGVWERAEDFDVDADVTSGATVWVSEGNTCADARFTLATDDPIALNTDGLNFVQTSGAGSIIAGDGLIKTGNTIDVNPGDGIEIISDAVSVNLSATPGLQFNAGELEVLVDPAGGLVLGAGGVAANPGPGIDIDGSNQLIVDILANSGLGFSGNELQVLLGASSGLSFDGAGAVSINAGAGLFVDGSNNICIDLADTNPGLQFNGTDELEFLADPNGGLVVGPAGVAAAVDGTTIQVNGSGQLEVLGASEAAAVCNAYTVGAGGVSAGDPVYFSADDTVSGGDAATKATARKIFGLAKTTEAAAGTVEVASEGVLAGAISGATAGDFVYLGVGGGLVTSAPTSGSSVMLVGYAINATDVFVKTQWLGKRA